MEPFTVTDKPTLRGILEAFSFLDEVRWNAPSNYNLLNYCDEDISAGGKILTHWLCYVMDRQMPFLRVWEIGGYIISHLVREYEGERDRPVRDIFDAHVARENGKRRLKAPPAGSDNPRLERFGIVQFHATDVLTVRTMLPSLTERQLAKLPHDLAASYPHRSMSAVA